MALARIRRTRIDQLVEEGSKTAAVVRRHLNTPDRFISACQLGITLDTLALGAIGEHVFADDLAWLASQLSFTAGMTHVLAPAVRVGCYIAAFSVTAFLQTLFGELLPKTLTFQRAESVILKAVWPMDCWCWLTSPIVVMLDGISSFILRLFKVKDPPRHHFVHTEEELKMLVSASQEEGVLEEEEEEMLHSVFDFSETHASEVMTPRTDMVCITAGATVKEFLDLALNHGLSRLPVYEQNIDSIFGAVHIRDCLRAMTEQGGDNTVKNLVRNVLIVPENKQVGGLLTEFKKTKTHMAIVVDEYGGTSGLVTIEDLIEELVGEIADEHEADQVYIAKQDDGSYLLDAKLSLEEANEELGLHIEDEEFQTIGGHVFGCLGHEPQAGDHVGNDSYTLWVEEADRHRIIKLRLIHGSCDQLEAAAGENGAGSARDKEGGDPTSRSLEVTK